MNPLKRFSAWLIHLSRGWVALGVFVVFVLFALLVLPAQSPAKVSPVSAVGIPDLLFFYTPQTLYAMAAAYGEAGRAEYIRGHLTIDVIWPLIYTAALVTGISWAFGRILAPESRWRRGNLVPVAGIFFDFAENLSTSWVVYRYPALPDGIARLAAFFTAGKWVLAALSLLLLGMGLAGVCWMAIRSG